MDTMLAMIADAVTDNTTSDGIPSFEKIGLITVLLVLGYLFMTRKVVVGVFYADALEKNRELDAELKAVRKVNHDLRNINQAAMLQITELTHQLAEATAKPNKREPP